MVATMQLQSSCHMGGETWSVGRAVTISMFTTFPLPFPLLCFLGVDLLLDALSRRRLRPSRLRWASWSSLVVRRVLLTPQNLQTSIVVFHVIRQCFASFPSCKQYHGVPIDIVCYQFCVQVQIFRFPKNARTYFFLFQCSIAPDSKW